MATRRTTKRSIAGDSWSVKSEYGSTLDGDDGMRVYELTVGGPTIAEGAAHRGGAGKQQWKTQMKISVPALGSMTMQCFLLEGLVHAGMSQFCDRLQCQCDAQQ